MKKTIVAVVLAAMSGGVWAEWVKMSEIDEAVTYLDPATIRRDRSLRRVWELYDLKVRAKGGEMSRRAFSEYDCKEERFRMLSNTAHSGPMAAGETLSAWNTPGEWIYIAPGTLAEYALKYVCAR